MNIIVTVINCSKFEGEFASLAVSLWKLAVDFPLLVIFLPLPGKTASGLQTSLVVDRKELGAEKNRQIFWEEKMNKSTFYNEETSFVFIMCTKSTGRYSGWWLPQWGCAQAHCGRRLPKDFWRLDWKVIA